MKMACAVALLRTKSILYYLFVLVVVDLGVAFVSGLKVKGEPQLERLDCGNVND